MPGTRVNLVRVFTKKGIGSRQQAREWILAGRVRVNGQVQRFIYTWVDLQKDVIELDGKPLEDVKEKIYLLFHKPAGYLTTRTDHQHRPTIYDLLPSFGVWVFPAGRLDMDSEGLLFLTNDGPFAEKLIHPDHGIFKTYEVQLNKPLQESDRLQLEQGVVLNGYQTKPAVVEYLLQRDGHWVQIKISEGKNRQVRRMFDAVGYKVKRLIRTAIGPLKLEGLQPGQWRHLTSAELTAVTKLFVDCQSI